MRDNFERPYGRHQPLSIFARDIIIDPILSIWRAHGLGANFYVGQQFFFWPPTADNGTLTGSNTSWNFLDVCLLYMSAKCMPKRFQLGPGRKKDAPFFLDCF
jgi:hypothetical protein